MAKEEKKPDQAAGPEADAAAGSKKKKLILIGAIAGGVLLVGGGAAFFLLGGKGEKPEAAATDVHAAPAADAHGDAKKDGAHGGDGKGKDAHGEKTAEAGGQGEKAKQAGQGGGGDAAKAPGGGEGTHQTVIVDVTGGRSMVINLRNPTENRAVKIAVSVQVKDDEKGTVKTKITTDRNAMFRDAIIAVVGARSRESLLSPDGKEALRRELLNRFNQTAMENASPVIEAVFITDFYIE